MIDQIQHYIEKHHLIPSGATIVLGLSGGPDSVFLLHVLYALQRTYHLKLIAAHLDHQWRSNSSLDVAFCADICQKLQVPFVHTTIAQLDSAIKKNGSLEEFGRKTRRYFFEHVRKEHNADYIALAHHAQDQQETFFIRLIRGATLSGLTSMKPKHGVYIRPLLQTNKKEILEYLDTHGIGYLEDPSNLSATFLRNRIRQLVLPALQECDERFDHNFLRTMEHLQETEDFLNSLTQKAFDQITQKSDNTFILDIKKFIVLDQFLQKRVIMHWLIAHKLPFTPSEGLVDEIIRFLNQPDSKAHHIHETWSIIKKKNTAFFMVPASSQDK